MKNLSRNKAIYNHVKRAENCNDITAKYLEKNLKKICPINYQLHIYKGE